MTSPRDNVPDSRSYQSRLERELVLGASLIGIVVGVGLIYLMWGQTAALTSLACLALVLVLAGLLWGFLTILGRIGGQG